MQVASAKSQVQVASARSQVQLTCEEFKSLLRAAGCRRHSTKIDPLRGLAWSRCKNSRFFAILFWPRDPLRGSARSRYKTSRFVFSCDFVWSRATLCGDGRGRGAKTRGSFGFCFGSRDPLRGSAWSRCKNSSFLFSTFVVRAGPRELSRGSGACSRDQLVAGSIPPGPRAARFANARMVQGRDITDLGHSNKLLQCPCPLAAAWAPESTHRCWGCCLPSSGAPTQCPTGIGKVFARLEATSRLGLALQPQRNLGGARS